MSGFVISVPSDTISPRKGVSSMFAEQFHMLQEDPVPCEVEHSFLSYLQLMETTAPSNASPRVCNRYPGVPKYYLKMMPPPSRSRGLDRRPQQLARPRKELREGGVRCQDYGEVTSRLFPLNRKTTKTFLISSSLRPLLPSPLSPLSLSLSLFPSVSSRSTTLL